MSSYRRGGSSSNECRIYVGNLPPDIREKDISDVFYKYGEIANIDLKKNTHGVGPPFAFVEFKDRRDAVDAKQAKDGFDYDGYILRVEYPKSSGKGGSTRGGFSDRGSRSFSGSRPKGPPPRRSNYRCFVSGLPSTGSWQDLKDHMREAGDVCFTDVYNDGTGVVEFLRREDMDYACTELNHSKFRSHEGESGIIRVKADDPSPTRSRSRSISPKRRGGYSPQYSSSYRHSRSRSRSLSRNRSYSRSSSRSRD
ncbi:serine/arginine-rich splicing factor 1A-like [Apostichopus japonicus]|uniref:serine/arginine-rich splicing factor 1A-like n=1 Tax=Stichopus japonicus TaxID=307972 RepID=UPI003AB85346